MLANLRWPAIALALFVAAAIAETPPKSATIDFQREIRPLLSDNCFQCHGPDSDTRMAGLRLDHKETAFEMRKNGAAIVPGKSAESLLYRRISAANPAQRMPPERSHKSLTPAQIAKLKQWIDQGAPWQEHWAYRAPVSAPLPAVRNAAWSRNPIDRFILARLEAKGLSPAPPADNRTLIRRVALDVTGLPPTPAEIEAFLKDTSPNAYEHMIDRYLASPHYGEHRARYWLDAARYGDTHGIHVDNYREIWPYRDWVIQAFNRNEHFDQFTIEQLAGDMLPNATLDQRVATGFVRCGVTTNEAGIIEDEYAEIYAKDRADTMGAVFLGLTVGCATCHDHKFDPITQKDFYGLGAFFRNTTQQVMDGNVPDTPPIAAVPRSEDRAAYERASARLTAIHGEMQQAERTAVEPFNAWLERRNKLHVKTPLEAGAELFAADLAALAKPDGPAQSGDSDVAARPALHFIKNEGVPVSNAPKLDAGKPFTMSVNFFFPKAEQGYVIAEQNNPKDKNRGWIIDIGARVIGLRLTGDGGRNIEARAAHLAQLQQGTWNSLVVSYDGTRHPSGFNMFVNGRVVPTQGRGNQNVDLAGDIGVDAPLMLGRSLEGGAISDFRIFNRAVDESEAQLLARWPAIQSALDQDGPTSNADSRAALMTYFLVNQYAPYRKLAHERNNLEGEVHEIARRGSITLVMEERKDSEPFAYVLYRGAYDQKRDRVEARTPSILPPMTSSMPRNRLGFARWLFTDDNPLTARVTVNRMWQELFGNGIVKTVDDFGSQGEPPSHPELLDWLAVDFRTHNWDVKRFYKEVLVSATYRQSARATPEKIEKDPENRLLSRGPRYRLDGELVRDYALAASGMLSPQIGGPSVKPYQPEGVWEAVAMIGSNTRFYQEDKGDGLYRRSLYTFWKRSAPPASMEIFNAPTREYCTVRRERTDTPLQALVTMNDIQFVEAARELAERGMQSTADFDERLDFLSTRLLARTFTAKERAIARRSYDQFRGYYTEHQGDAAKLLNEGERKPDPALPPADYAAMTMLANQMLNLDEVLNK
jgi:mono/diheme cytochrome c family protein